MQTVVHGIFGGIAAGKTTYAKKLSMLYKLRYIPEFLDMDITNNGYDGHTLLSAFINKTVTPYEFQLHILNIIDTYLSTHIPEGPCIIESPPTYALEVYGRSAVANGAMSEQELSRLIALAIKLSEKYGLPIFRRCPVLTVTRDQCQALSQDNQVVLYMDVDFDTTLVSIRERARDDEDQYNVEYLRDIHTRARSIVDTQVDG
jgi:adenylate kinase family enzyme